MFHTGGTVAYMLADLHRLFEYNLRPFGAKVAVAADHLTDEEAASFGIRKMELAQMFSECDIVSLHETLTPATRHMIGADLLERLRPGA